MLKRNIIILILGILCILIILSYFLLNLDDKEDNDTETNNELSIETDIVDKGNYWQIKIIEVSGGKLNLNDVKFMIVPKEIGISVCSTKITNTNPESIVFNDSIGYPIPGKIGFVYENETTGDGEIVDTDSVSNPEIWEGCYIAYIDSQSDNLVNAEDHIWLFKDINDDGINDTESGDKFIMFDREVNIISKEILF